MVHRGPDGHGFFSAGPIALAHRRLSIIDLEGELEVIDVDALADRVAEAGGTLVAPAFDVGDQGKMAVFQDPSGVDQERPPCRG
jgi:predicted enzyme related to lactoylglutathione lyase